MAAKQLDAWLFVAEWYDPMPQLKRQYLLKYFVDTHMVEMIDVKSKKMFLKKSNCPPEVTPSDFYIGGKVHLYSRELTIVDFGDMKTRSILEKQSQKTLVLIPSNSYTSWGKIVDDVLEGFSLVGIQTLSLDSDRADAVIDAVDENPNLSKILSKNISLLLVVHGPNGINALGNFCSTLADRYNCVMIAPTTGSQVEKLLNEVLKGPLQIPTATLTNCTCCLVKPHAVKAKAVGPVIAQIIAEGFDISAITTVCFDRTTAEEFLEVYKGVVPEYADHTVQLCAGMSVAIEVVAEEDTVNSFRRLAGPWDVEIAREIRPSSIRAKHGRNRVMSGVHCTDLECDAANEVEYCFHIMSSLLA